MSRRMKHEVSLESERANQEGGDIRRGEVSDVTGRSLFFARRPFGYLGKELDRGQVVAFTNAPNDTKLIRLGYVLALLTEDRPVTCRVCGEKFIDSASRDVHGAKRHASQEEGLDVPFSPRGATVDTESAAQVQALEREQAKMDQIAPLNLDKTLASQQRY